MVGGITSLVSQLVALPRIILLSHRSYLPVTWRRLFSDSLVICRIVVIAIPLLSRLMKYLVPEDDLRLEVHFLVSLFICILGLLTTVNGKTTYAATEEALNWKAIILSIGLFVILFLIGFAWNKLKWPLLQRKELKKRSKINQ